MRCVHGRDVGLWGGECWECEQEKRRHQEILEKLEQVGQSRETKGGATHSGSGGLVTMEDIFSRVGMVGGALLGALTGFGSGFEAGGGIGMALVLAVVGAVVGGLGGLFFGAIVGSLLPIILLGGLVILLGGLVYVVLRLLGMH